MTEQNFDRIAKDLIWGFDFDSIASNSTPWDIPIASLENELAEARASRTEYLDKRQERLALLEHLGYARRSANGEWTISEHRIEGANA